MNKTVEQVRLEQQKQILSTKGYIKSNETGELLSPKTFLKQFNDFFTHHYDECFEWYFATTARKLKQQIYKLEQECDYHELAERTAALKFAFKTQHPIDDVSICTSSGEPYFKWICDDELLELFGKGLLEPKKHPVELMEESERAELVDYVQQLEKEKRKKKKNNLDFIF